MNFLDHFIDLANFADIKTISKDLMFFLFFHFFIQFVTKIFI